MFWLRTWTSGRTGSPAICAALADGRLAETDLRACAGRLMALARRLTANR